jgi:1-deoxy-D-xylulose-5-phosphate synthase
MVKLCDQNNYIVGITAAMPSGTGLKALEKAMPNRYYDVGIAEEHAVLFAAGMATMGFKPVCAIYSTFLQRAYDCIVHDVALQDLPVIFCMDRAGLSANDGPTHHGLFDIAYLRCVPNIIGMAPKDEDELVDMMFTATHQQHPTFIRYPRGAGEGVAIKDQPQLLEIGKAEILKPFSQNGGRRVAFLALGNMQKLAREAASRLGADGVDCALVNARFFKPIDQGTTEFFARTADVVVTIEDHVLMGGYGSAVLELLSQKQITTPVVRIGWPDQYIEHASSVDYLRERHGLTVSAIVEKAREALKPPVAETSPKVASMVAQAH